MLSSSLLKRFPNLLIFLVLLISLIIVYGRLLHRDYFLYADDFMIVEHAKKIKDIFQYLENLSSFNTLDFQPVRDLTFWFDYYCFGGNNHPERFTQMNLFYWGIFCLVCFKYFSKKFNHQTASFLAILIAIYPTFTWSVAVIAARKHILAAIFSVLYLSQQEKKEQTFKSLFLAMTYYVLSVLSNPITVFVPIGAQLTSLQKEWKRNYKIFLMWLALVSLMFFTNYFYYQAFFRKINVETLTSPDIGLMISAFGRYWFQLAIPVKFSIFYASGSVSEFIGLLLFVTTALMAFKLLEREKFLQIFLLIFSVLFIPIVRVSHNFICDHYLILPGVFYLSCLVELFLKLEFISSNKIAKNGIPILLLTFCFIKSYKEVSHTLDPMSFTRISFEREAVSKNAQGYFYELLIRNLEDEIIKVTPTLISADLNVGLPILTIILYYSKDYKFKEKIVMLEKKGSYFSQTVAELIKLENDLPNNFNERYEFMKKHASYYSQTIMIFLNNRSRIRQSKEGS